MNVLSSVRESNLDCDILITISTRTHLQHKTHIGVVHSSRRHVRGKHDHIGPAAELLGGASAVSLRLPRVHLENIKSSSSEQEGHRLGVTSRRKENNDFE